MIYFLLNPVTGCIKIGTTINYHGRVKDLESRHKMRLELLGAMNGDVIIEKWLHRQFANIQAKDQPGKEWFQDMPELREFIKSHTHRYIPPKINDKRSAALDSRVYLELKVAADLLDWSYSEIVSVALRELIPDIDAEVEKREASRAKYRTWQDEHRNLLSDQGNK